MTIIGCDLHTRYQVVAWMDEETGEIRTRRLEHENGEARAFYSSLPRGARVGIEATVPALWFERMLAEVRARAVGGRRGGDSRSEVRRQKTDTRDAEHMLDLLRTNRFPRIWVPSLEERDLRQLLVHRMKLVRARTTVKNQLHLLAMSQGVCRKQKLWTAKGRAELEGLTLLPWASRRRQRTAGNARPTGRRDRGAGPSGGARKPRLGGGGATDEPARGRAGRGFGLRADAGAGRAVSQQPQGGELPGPESARGFQRRPATLGQHQQARQFDDALAAGGSRASGGACTIPNCAARINA